MKRTIIIKGKINLGVFANTDIIYMPIMTLIFGVLITVALWSQDKQHIDVQSVCYENQFAGWQVIFVMA